MALPKSRIAAKVAEHHAGRRDPEGLIDWLVNYDYSGPQAPGPMPDPDTPEFGRWWHDVADHAPGVDSWQEVVTLAYSHVLDWDVFEKAERRILARWDREDDETGR